MSKSLPECCHPFVKVIRAETLDVESGIVGIDMDIFPATDRSYGSLSNLYLITGGLARMKRIRKQS